MEVRSGGARRKPMPHDVYYQFITTPGQARRAGARGGKATVRNRRERLDRTPAALPEPKAGSQSSLETTAAAIALLDMQYPWLRGAEKRFSNRSPHAACERSEERRVGKECR